MGRKAVRDPGDHGLCGFVLLFPCCFPVFIWKANISPKHFAIALIFWIFFIALAAGLTYRFGFHGSNTWRVFPAEERVLDNHRFTDELLCSGVSLVGSNDAKFFAYATAEPPKLAPRSRVEYRLMRKFHLPTDKLELFSVFLPPMSVLAAGVCAEDEAFMYLIRGDDNLDCVIDSFYQNGQVDHSCVSSVTHVEPGANSTCHKHPWQGAWARTMTSDTAAQFHVVFEAVGDTAQIQAVIMMNRSSYAIPEGEPNLQFCNWTTQCFFPYYSSLWSGARTVVVLQVAPENRSHMKVTASCQPNLVAYFLIFGAIPVLVAACIGIVTYRIHRNEVRARENRVEPREPGDFFQSCDTTLPVRIQSTDSTSSELRPILRT